MKLKTVYFSPTGTTKAVSQKIAHCLLEVHPDWEHQTIDLTLLSARKTPLVFSPEDLVIFGFPVYAGRLPNLLLPFLRQLKGQGALVAAVVVYGNRAYDYALIELTQLLEETGFRLLAAGAFVGEHAFSTTLAKGRPNKDDFSIAAELALAIDEKRRNGKTGVTLPAMGGSLVYYIPRGEDGQVIDIRPVKPVTDRQLCIDCKLCAQVCPLESIDYDDVTQTPGICMSCCSCIKRCPTGAKSFQDAGFLYHKQDLEMKYTASKKSEFWV